MQSDWLNSPLSPVVYGKKITVTVNLETSICKLGRILFHKKSYVRCPLFFLY